MNEKEKALREYKDALAHALRKREQCEIIFFKEYEKDKQLVEDMASTCTKQFFERMKRGNGIEENISYMELLRNDKYERKERDTKKAIKMYQDSILELRGTICRYKLFFITMLACCVVTTLMLLVML